MEVKYICKEGKKVYIGLPVYTAIGKLGIVIDVRHRFYAVLDSGIIWYDDSVLKGKEVRCI